MANVGGVNISVGADIRGMTDGLDAVTGTLKKFQVSLKNIKLDAAIKGNPFKETFNHLRTTRKELNDVFDEWKKYIGRTDMDMGKFAEKTASNVKRIIVEFEKIKGQMESLTAFPKKSGDLFGAFETGGKAGLLTQINDITKGLETKFGTLGQKIRKEFALVVSSMGKDIDPTKLKTDLDRIFGMLDQYYKEKGEPLRKQYAELGEELRKAFKLQAGAELGEKLKQASDPNVALERRKKVMQELIIAYKRSKTEIGLGINTEKNWANVMSILEQKLQMRGKLTRQQAIELARLRAEQQRYIAEQKSTGTIGEIFTVDWWKQRARWFVQLRLMWGAYRNIMTFGREIVEMHRELARAMRTASSETMSLNEISKKYYEAMLTVIPKFNLSIKDAGESLYQLGSAGLKAEEALAAVNSTIALNVALEGNMADTTKMVASIYKNFGDQMGKFTTQAEKFQHIGDIITQTFNEHIITLPEIVDGLKQSSGMALAAGISFEQLIAMMATLNDHMIKGGTAGRALQNVFMRIARTPHAFIRAFQLKDTFDPQKPIEFEKVMKTLHERMKDGTMSAYELGLAFERMGIRGAPAFIILTRYWNEYEQTIARHEVALGSLEETTKRRLDNIGDQWGRFAKAVKAHLEQNLQPYLDGLTHIFKKAADSIAETPKTAKQWEKEFEFLKEETIGAFKKDIENLPETDLENLLGNQIKLKKSAGERLTFLRDYYKRLDDLIEKRRKGEYETTGFLGGPRLVETIPKAKETIEEVKKLISFYEDLVDVGEEVEKFENRRIRELPLTDAERYLQYADRTLHVDKRIALINDHIFAKQKELNDAMADYARSRKKAGDETSKDLEEEETRAGNIIAAAENAKRVQEDLNKLYAERDKAYSEILKVHKEQEQSILKRLNLEKEGLNIGVKNLELTRGELQDRKDGESTLKEEFKINEEIRIKKERIAELDSIINTIQDASLISTIAENEELTKREELLRQQKDDRGSELKDMNRLFEKQREYIQDLVLMKKRELAFAEIENADKSKIIQLEIEMVQLRIQELEARKETLRNIKAGVVSTVEIARVNRQIQETTIELIRLNDDWKRSLDPVYDSYRVLQETLPKINQFISQTLVKGYSEIGSGLSQITFDITGGFQAQRQEVVNLRGELAQLEVDYDNAISEGNIAKAAQINQEMEQLHKNISDLENPIKQIGNAFRDFFKELVDSIRKAILDWLMMQAVMKVVGGFMGAGSAGAGGTYSVDSGILDWFGRAEGGITPKIKSFRQFSSGGLTSRPTLAMLGDNPSGQEIIIPTENIKSDEASGYMRDSKQNVTVINVLTETDIAAAMASTSGQRIILNTIGQDMRKKGTTYRSYNM